ASRDAPEATTGSAGGKRNRKGPWRPRRRTRESALRRRVRPRTPQIGGPARPRFSSPPRPHSPSGTNVRKQQNPPSYTARMSRDRAARNSPQRNSPVSARRYLCRSNRTLDSAHPRHRRSDTRRTSENRLSDARFFVLQN